MPHSISSQGVPLFQQKVPGRTHKAYLYTAHASNHTTLGLLILYLGKISLKFSMACNLA
jgi:hypothetical protein